MDWIQAIGELFRRDRPAVGALADYRTQAYSAYDAYYDNTIYDRESIGGQREAINRVLGNEAAADLSGLYNPVARCVGLYQHAFGGAFGDDIRVEAENTLLAEPLEHIWRWSNINRTIQRLCKLAPLHGNVGLRIVANRERQRIRLNIEHPRVIQDVSLDAQGNVDAVLLEYDLEIGPMQKRQLIRVREEQTPDVFRTWRLENGLATPFDLTLLQDHGPLHEYANELGVVPYVLLGHTADLPWSSNAWYQSRPTIDRLNALITHINVQIHEHVRAAWLVAASGTAPQSFDFSGKSIIYVNTQQSGGMPSATPLIANLSLADSLAEAQALIEIVEDMLPELKATGGRFLAGQSGETVAQLRKPANDKLAQARGNYEDALVRAQQIALSWGVLYGLWDVGTGSGTLEAAEKAYHSGAEDHQFNQRQLLPLNELERLQIAQQKKALGFSSRTVFEDLGVADPDAEVEQGRIERDQNRASFATAFDRGA